MAAKDKRPDIEQRYQKKTLLEHVLLRPDTYIGSTEKATQQMWVYDEERNTVLSREITFVPGLYKIFDEILVNAADHKVRDKAMTCIKIEVNKQKNQLKVWNNGTGIPVEIHREHKVYVPSMIFGELLTSSNYDDSEKKVTGGRNGLGAKVCNIFSKRFEVQTSSREYGRSFKQVWYSNMGRADECIVGESASDDFTSVTFEPDLQRFRMPELDDDVVSLFTRRAYDVAATSGAKVFLNGKRLPISSFRDYVDMFMKSRTDEEGNEMRVAYERVNARWEVACTVSDAGFQQISFVNNIATTKGGTHIDYVSDQIVKKLLEAVKKKSGKDAVKMTAHQVKTHIWLFVNCLVENPTFDSQTKENMTLQQKSFGSTCELSEAFFKSLLKTGLLERVQNWMKFKALEKMDQQCSKKKHSKLKGIPKLDDANMAGTKNSEFCTLILTEGDSAKSLAVSGLGVVGRDRYGVFPLRGKVLNVREANTAQVLKNAEINNLLKIVGLQYRQKYDSPEQIKSLRYGKIMIMTDQDQDGSHIKGLLINFVQHYWPNLLRYNFLEQFITPIVKAFKGKEEHSFYSLPEFEEWKASTPNAHTYRIKYYKGLGTSTSKEAKDYFSDMNRHRIKFGYSGSNDDESIKLAFSKKLADNRKVWLTEWMQRRRDRLQAGLGEDYLYGPGTRSVTYSDFVNKELILFSNMDNERSIPSLVDGLKPGQRKVMFTCFKRGLVKELKVAQLAGSVAELSAYHHGEQSLMQTIINLAQNFVGSNNINLLRPIGMFGTRLQGGKDAASPRYIFTALSSLARTIFKAADEPLLHYNLEDNQRVEPEWYAPVLPTVLVNGAEGIGTGWMTKIPNFDPRSIVKNLRHLIRGEPIEPLHPYYKNFRGEVIPVDARRYAVCGEIAQLDEQSIEITELPVGVWTQSYKESVLEEMLQGTEKEPPTILDYSEYHTDTTVRFVVRMTEKQLNIFRQQGLHRAFKLIGSVQTTNMVLFDSRGCIRRYETVEEILREFYDVRLDMYAKRKTYLLEQLGAEASLLNNQARFILEKIEGIVKLENKPKKAIIAQLIERKFDSDPVKAWKDNLRRKSKEIIEDDDAAEQQANDDDESAENANEKDDISNANQPDYNYLLNMALWSLTKERVDELIKNRDKKKAELDALRAKSPADLWMDDLDVFSAELDKVEQQEREDEEAGIADGRAEQRGDKKLKRKAGRKSILRGETQPSRDADRISPPPVEDLAKKLPALKRPKEEGEVDPEANPDGEPAPGGAPSGAKKPRGRAGKKKEDGDAAVKSSQEGGADVKKPKRPAKAKKHGSDESEMESDNDSDAMSMNDFDDDDVAAPKRDTRPKRDRPTNKIVDDLDIDSIDEDKYERFDKMDSDSEFETLNSDAEAKKPKKTKKTTQNAGAKSGAAPAKSKPAASKKPKDSGGDDSDASDFEVQMKKIKKPASKKKNNFSDDDDSDSDADFGAPKRSKAPKKTKAAETAKPKRSAKSTPASSQQVFDSSESEFEADSGKAKNVVDEPVKQQPLDSDEELMNVSLSQRLGFNSVLDVDKPAAAVKVPEPAPAPEKSKKEAVEKAAAAPATKPANPKKEKASTKPKSESSKPKAAKPSAPKSKPAATKKRAKDSDSEDDEIFSSQSRPADDKRKLYEFDADEPAKRDAPARTKRTAAAKIQYADDDDDEDDSFAVYEKKPTKKKRVADSDDEFGSDVMEISDDD